MAASSCDIDPELDSHTSIMTFVHAPLDETTGEIRLLSFLEPLDASPDHISCTIEHVPYTEEVGWGDFAAISYVWGEETESQHITLDGHRFAVRNNLLAALKGVRSILSGQSRERCTGKVWVDALCINQDDVLERNHQVGRMREIFSRTKTTYCFLPLTWSAEASDTKIVQQTLSCHLAINMINALHTGGDMGDRARLLTKLRYATTEFSTKSWYALYQFFTNPFWARVWIIQEITLSIDVQVVVGEHVVSWAVVAGAAYAVRDGYHPIMALMMESALPLPLHIQPYWSVVCSIEVLRTRRDGRSNADWNKRNPWLYIDLVSRATCSDPRDKVYGVLSLLPADWADLIGVDYLKDYTAVCRECIVASIRLTGNLRVLPHYSLPNTADFPSWLPDLRDPNLFRHFRETNMADNGLVTNSPEHDEARRLIVHGLRVGTIDNISPHVPRQFRAVETACSPHTSGKYSSSSPYVDISNAQMQDELAATLIPGSRNGCLPSTAWLKRHESSAQGAREALMFFTKHADFVLPNGTYLGDLMERIEVSEKFEDDYRLFVGDLDYDISYRRLACTTTGRMAMAPPYARKGDMVCVLKGLDTLAVLRPADYHTWYWIGDCFIRGAMRGEGIVGREKDARKFVLV